MNAFWTEVRMVASTVVGLIPGRRVWIPPLSKLDQAWADSAKPAVLELASSELRATYGGEVEGVERVRQRAQFALTALVAAAGISATTAQDTLIQGSSLAANAMWIAGFAIVVLACLIFAGVFVARKVVGVPTVDDLATLGVRAARRELAKSYERAIEITRATRGAALTVFRDGVLLGLVGLALIVGANGVVVFTATPDTSQSPAPTPISTTTTTVTPTPTATLSPTPTQSRIATTQAPPPPSRTPTPSATVP